MAYYALILTWFLDYIRPGAAIPLVSTLKIYTVVPIIAFILAVAAKSQTSHREVVSSPAFVMLALFLFWILLSALVAIDMNLTFTFLNQAFGYTLMFYCIVRVADSFDKVRGLMRVLVLLHVLLIYLNPDLVTNPEVRSYLEGVTFLGDGNDFALSVCFVLPMGIYLLQSAEWKFSKLLYAASTAVLALAVIGTQSRGGSLALGFTLLYLWWNSRNRMVGGIAIATLVIAGLMFAGESYFTRMSTLAHISGEGSAQGRLDAWSQAVYLGVRVNPALGVGAGNFPLQNNGLTAHSIYFLALGELGIPGLAFAIGFFLSHYRRNSKALGALQEVLNERSADRLLLVHLNASIIGLGTAGAFLSALYYPHIFIMGGLVVASHCVLNRLSEDKRSQCVDNASGGANVRVSKRQARRAP